LEEIKKEEDALKATNNKTLSELAKEQANNLYLTEKLKGSEK